MTSAITPSGSNRGGRIATLQASLKTVYAVLESLPLEERAAAQESLRAIWRSNLHFIDLIQEAEKIIAQSDSTLSAAISGMNILADQRNQAMEEVERLTQMLDEHRDQVWETVLESLPNDIAAALNIPAGDAQLLYNLLNAPAESFDEEGIPPELINHFRATILDVFQQLKGMLDDQP